MCGNAVYATSVVLWMLVSQRMNPERSLALKRMLDTQPDFLRRNKRITEKTLSNATGRYRHARSRLQRDAAKWFAERVRDSLIEATAPSFDGRRVYLVLKPANFFWKGFWFESQKRNPSVICGV